MIKFSHVTKKFPDNSIALSDVHFEIPNKQFVFLVGPSGAGKTTILRLLIKDLEPTEGEILLDGEDVTKIPSAKIHLLRRKIGTIFQDYKLLPDKTVGENIALVLEAMSKPQAEIDTTVDNVCEMVGISGKKDLFPQQLSGGEMQRTAIARAIVADPEVILADEPTGDLDPKNAWEIIKLLARINDQSGATIIMATHNTEIVNSLKKRVIRIDRGKIVKDEKQGKYESA